MRATMVGPAPIFQVQPPMCQVAQSSGRRGENHTRLQYQKPVDRPTNHPAQLFLIVVHGPGSNKLSNRRLLKAPEFSWSSLLHFCVEDCRFWSASPPLLQPPYATLVKVDLPVQCLQVWPYRVVPGQNGLAQPKIETVISFLLQKPRALSIGRSQANQCCG